MSRFYISGNAVDQNDIPVVGALVYVRANGVLATIQDAAGESLANPLTTIADGFFEAYSTNTGQHTLEYYWGGKLRRVDTVSDADAIQAAAQAALAAVGADSYPNTAAGLAGTAIGETFFVVSGGVGTIYRHDAGPTATEISKFIVDPQASTGSSLVGHIASGTGATARTVQAKLRDTVSVRDFGAVGDGVTNDATAFQNAINTGKNVFVPRGTYLISSALNITAPAAIQGENKLTIISLPASASFDLFRIASSNVMVKDIAVQGNGTQTGSIFKLRSSLGSFEMFFFENIETNDCHHFLTDENSSGVLTLCYVENCFHRQPTGNGIDVNDIFAYFFMDRFTVDYVGVTAASSNTPGVRVRNGQGCRFTNVDVLGGTIAGMANRRGFDIQNSEAVWLNRCMADTMGGEGVFLSNCNGVYLSEITGSLCDLHQIVIDACVNVVGTSLYAGGRNALSGTASQDGVRISGGSAAVALSSVLTVSNTQHGLHILGANSGAVVTGLTSRLNTGRGFRCGGLSAMITGAQLASNTAGNYELAGTFDHATSIQLNSGALVVSATGPVTA